MENVHERPPSSPDFWTRRRWTMGLLGLACLVIGIASVRFHRGLPYDFDEEYWIGSSYYFGLVTSGQWDHSHWQLLPARENPPIGKYAFGLVLTLAGHPVRSIDLLAHWYGVYRDIPGAWGSPEDGGGAPVCGASVGH